jgi:hypothetical protein
MTPQYQVTAPCVVHIPVTTSAGTSLNTFYKDAILPPDVPEARIKQLLDSHLIAEVAVGSPAVEQQEGGEQPVAVNARSKHAELVAYGVAQGGDQAELGALTREQLLERYVRKPE